MCKESFNQQKGKRVKFIRERVQGKVHIQIKRV